MPTQLLRLRRHADGYYRTQWVDGNGIRHKKSFGNRKRPAETRFAKFYHQWRMADGVRNPHLTAAAITIREGWGKFHDHAEAYYRRADGSPSRHSQALTYAFRPVLDLFGDDLAKDFGPKKLKLVREEMIARGWCVNNINRRVCRIRHVFKWLSGEELVPEYVWHALQAVQSITPGRTPAVISKPVVPVPIEHVVAVQAVVVETVRSMIETQYLTGARPDEICSMRPIDIDTTQPVWVYRPVQHKTLYAGRPRLVLLGPKAQAVVRPFLVRPPASYMFSPRDAHTQRMKLARKNRKSKVQPSQKNRAVEHPKKSPGQRYTTQSYGRAIAYACKKHDIPHWSPGQLRHNAATRIRLEFGLDAAQVVLGHATADVTQMYADVDLRRAIAAMEKIG